MIASRSGLNGSFTFSKIEANSMYCCYCGARIYRDACFCHKCGESVASSPIRLTLERILAARTESELRWADDYCQMEIRSAVGNKEKRFWKRTQRGVGCAMRRLSLTEDHITAYNWSSYHRLTLMESNLCGCFHCLEVFPTSEIEDWIHDGETALCPKCGIDSVIGSRSGYSIQREFLAKMHNHWFLLMPTPDMPTL